MLSENFKNCKRNPTIVTSISILFASSRFLHSTGLQRPDFSTLNISVITSNCVLLIAPAFASDKCEKWLVFTKFKSQYVAIRLTVQFYTVCFNGVKSSTKDTFVSVFHSPGLYYSQTVPVFPSFVNKLSSMKSPSCSLKQCDQRNTSASNKKRKYNYY